MSVVAGVSSLKYGMDHIAELKAEPHGNLPRMDDGAADHVRNTALMVLVPPVLKGLKWGTEGVAAMTRVATASPKAVKLSLTTTAARSTTRFQSQQGFIDPRLFFNLGVGPKAVGGAATVGAVLGGIKSGLTWDSTDVVRSTGNTLLNVGGGFAGGMLFSIAPLPTVVFAGSSYLGGAIDGHQLGHANARPPRQE